MEDAGTFTCTARNNAGSDQKRFSLSVHVPPTINGSEFLQQVAVVEGESIILECPTEGLPEPNLQWLREGKPLTFLTNPNLRFVNGEFMSSCLRIRFPMILIL